MDPDADGHNCWWIDHLFPSVPAQTHLAGKLQTFAGRSPRQARVDLNVGAAVV